MGLAAPLHHRRLLPRRASDIPEPAIAEALSEPPSPPRSVRTPVRFVEEGDPLRPNPCAERQGQAAAQRSARAGRPVRPPGGLKGEWVEGEERLVGEAEAERANRLLGENTASRSGWATSPTRSSGEKRRWSGSGRGAEPAAPTTGPPGGLKERYTNALWRSRNLSSSRGVMVLVRLPEGGRFPLPLCGYNCAVRVL